MPPESLSLIPIPGIPLIQPGDDLSAIIVQTVTEAGLSLRDDDILVISSKIVSKAENRYVDLTTVTPDAEAHRLAEITGKDPRIVALVLGESQMVSRVARNVLVTQHRLGFISANAGIDQSNVGRGHDVVLLLPENPDASAEAMRENIRRATGAEVGIVISDSHGRPFRLGNVGAAIGLAGVPGLRDLRGQQDLFGRKLAISIMAHADLIASAAHLVCGEGDEGLPVILLRGLKHDADTTGGGAGQLNRSPEQDLYR